MINITLTQQQIDELKIYYNLELEKVLKRVNEIKEIISKFENKQESNTENIIEDEPKKVFKTEEINVKKQKHEAQEIMKKRPTLSSQIVEILRNKNEPLKLKEIFKILKKDLNISKTDEKKTINNIEQNIHKLRNIDKKIESIKKEGIKERLYGLVEWNNIETNKKNEIAEITENKKVSISKPIQKLENKRIQNRQEAESNTPEFINWSDFITELLNKEKKLMQLKDFLQATLDYYKLSENKSGEIRGRLSPALTRLVEKTKVLKAISKENIKGRLYGLIEWFDENGEIKTSFNNDSSEKSLSTENKPKIEETRAKSKRGKSLWPEFILETIKNQKTIVQAKTIVDIAMNKFKIPVEKYSEIRVLLASNISNLENVKDKIKSIKIKGEKGNYYGLKEWFYDNGKIKIEYTKVGS